MVPYRFFHDVSNGLQDFFRRFLGASRGSSCAGLPDFSVSLQAGIRRLNAKTKAKQR